MSFLSFKTKWLGQRVDTDGVPKDAPYQCVDLIKEYLRDEYGIPFGAYGNAIDYWTHTAQVVLNNFDKIPGSEVQTGDVVVLNGLPGNLNGHLALATGNSIPTQIEVLEQNGHTGNGLGKDQDVIRTRYVDRSRVAGLLRFKSLQVPTVTVRVNQGNWNVRTGPEMVSSIRFDGHVIGGQEYAAQITNGWAQIDFMGSVGFIGPKAFTKL